MKKVSTFLTFLTFLTFSTFFAAAQNDKTEDRSFELSKNLEIFSKLYQTLYVNYVDDIDPGASMKKAIDAMLSALDPYTVYYPESDMEIDIPIMNP